MKVLFSLMKINKKILPYLVAAIPILIMWFLMNVVDAFFSINIILPKYSGYYPFPIYIKAAEESLLGFLVPDLYKPFYPGLVITSFVNGIVYYLFLIYFRTKNSSVFLIVLPIIIAIVSMLAMWYLAHLIFKEYNI